MPGREALGAGVMADVIQDQWFLLLDQQAEHAAAMGRIPDLLPQAVLDSPGQELLELGPATVENAECRVAGTGQFPGRLERVVDHRFGIGFDDETATDLDQTLEPGLIEGDGRFIHRANLRRRSAKGPGFKSAERYGNPLLCSG